MDEICRRREQDWEREGRKSFLSDHYSRRRSPGCRSVVPLNNFIRNLGMLSLCDGLKLQSEAICDNKDGGPP